MKDGQHTPDSEDVARTAEDLREQLHQTAQAITHLVDPGGLVIGWGIVISIASADNPTHGGVMVETMAGQGIHADLGLFEMGAGMTRRRSGIYNNG